MEKRVLYALVAHRQNSDWAVIASHSVDGANYEYLDVAFSAIEAAGNSMLGAISVDYDKYTAHVLVGEFQYVCLTLRADRASSASCLAKSSQDFLQRLRSVYWELLTLENLSRGLVHLSTIDLAEPMKTIVEEHNQLYCLVPNELPRLHGQLEEVRQALMAGIQKLIERGQRMEDLVQKTQNLQTSAQTNFRQCTKVSRKKSHACLVFWIVGSLILLLSSIIVTLAYIGIF